MMTNYYGKFLIYFFIAVVVFTSYVYFCGYFNIGFLSDDYILYYDAIHTNLLEKFNSHFLYTSNSYFRPVLYISFQASYFLHNLLNLSYDNVLFDRLQNLVLYFGLSFISGYIILMKSHRLPQSVFVFIFIMIFPNGLHNICWTSGRIDLLCGIFAVSTLYFTLLYFEKKSKLRLLFSLVTLILCVLTKESAITIPIIILVLVYLLYGVDVIKKRKYIVILQFLIFFAYVVYRLLFLRINLTGAIVFVQDHPTLSVSGVLIRSVISLIFPFDYVELKLNFLNHDMILIFYLLLVLTIIIFAIIVLKKSNSFKYLIPLIIVGILILSPYVYVGYIRPQIIFIPFIILLITATLIFEKFIKPKYKINKSVAIIICLIIVSFWTVWGYTVIKDWECAYVVSKKKLQELVKTEFDKSKPIKIIGFPLRLKQAIIMTPMNLNIAYNYWKYKEFSLIDYITPIFQVISIDSKSFQSNLRLDSKQENEFEISTSGNTQYFLNEDKDILSGDGSVEYFGYNNLNKPTMLRLMFNFPKASYYLLTDDKLVRLR